jgi:hypothetical protein
MAEVSRPTDRVVPISLCKIPSQLYTVLRDYKSGRSNVPTDSFALEIAALLDRFLRTHGQCIERMAGGDWDTLTLVPSTRRQGPPPMEAAITRSGYLESMYRKVLVRGRAKMVDRIADDDIFQMTEDATGERILLVDDTFTTGARVQSAASRLSLDGARVVAAVAVGRIINPEYSQDLWDRATAEQFDFDVCCLE